MRRTVFLIASLLLGAAGCHHCRTVCPALCPPEPDCPKDRNSEQQPNQPQRVIVEVVQKTAPTPCQEAPCKETSKGQIVAPATPGPAGGAFLQAAPGYAQPMMMTQAQPMMAQPVMATSSTPGRLALSLNFLRVPVPFVRPEVIPGGTAVVPATAMMPVQTMPMQSMQMAAMQPAMQMPAMQLGYSTAIAAAPPAMMAMGQPSPVPLLTQAAGPPAIAVQSPLLLQGVAAQGVTLQPIGASGFSEIRAGAQGGASLADLEALCAEVQRLKAAQERAKRGN